MQSTDWEGKKNEKRQEDGCGSLVFWMRGADDGAVGSDCFVIFVLFCG